MTKDNCLFVVFGATGDLAKKKLIPAFYNLLRSKKISDFAVIGVSLDNITTDELLSRSRPFVKNFDGKVWQKLKKRVHYFRANFHDEERYEDLKLFIEEIERMHNLSGNRLFYLATLPEHFEAIANNLGKNRMAVKRGNWARVAFEKPFGNDMKSAKKINRHVTRVFREKQIYRVDHYLGKELIQNISVIRFTNTILEPLWSRKYIDHVQIVLSENFGIEGRGNYYDSYGAIKDVVQNHMMQMICLTAMEAPRKLTAADIRNRKLKVLKAIRMNPKDIVVGQYDGYAKEKGVRKNSKTETFAALKMFVNNERWRGVPFYFITGKKMKEKITSIYVQFKQAPCLMLRGVCNFQPNYLVIQIQPDEGFYVQMNAKAPAKMEVVPIKLDFCHECVFGPNTPEAYENLLFDAVRGDQSAFIRDDEIEEAWKIIDKITAVKPKLKLNSYAAGKYPEEARRFIEKDSRYWHLVVK